MKIREHGVKAFILGWKVLIKDSLVMRFRLMMHIYNKVFGKVGLSRQKNR